MAVNDINTQAWFLVAHLKDKIVIATAMAILKLARKEGIAPAIFARGFQERYVMDNYDKIDTVLEQRFLGQCQDEVFEKLRKAIPVPEFHYTSREEPDDVLFGGNSLEWIENQTPASELRPKENTSLHCQTVRHKNKFSLEDCALKNIQFIESITNLRSESECKSTISTSFLQSLLYEDVKYDVNQPYYQNCPENARNRQFSEDSGIGCSEELSENNNFNFVSSGVVKFALQTSNTNQLVVQSTRFVVNYIKSDVRNKPEEVFMNWKGSLVEYACDTVCECSLVNADCREMVLSFVYYLLEDVWCDKRMAQHRHWEMKMSIVNEFLTDSESCYEIIQYISDKLEHFIECLTRKDVSRSRMAEKLCLFLNLYLSVFETIKKVKTKQKSKDEVKLVDSEDTDVTNLWQEKWRLKPVDHCDQELVDIDSQIEMLEKLIIRISRKYPLISMLAVKALTLAKTLSKSGILSHNS